MQNPLGNKPKDILIVGSGLAGTTLAIELQKRGVRVQLIDNQMENSSSRVAAGIINPIVPKGVKKTWQFDEIFPHVFSYYRALEAKFQTSFIQEYPMLQIHANSNEKHEWRKRAENADMIHLLSAEGENTIVHLCGRLDVPKFLNTCKLHFEAAQRFRSEPFNHEEITIHENQTLEYRKETFDAIVFCEGIGIKQNPWFHELFFDPTAGDILTVKIPHLDNHRIIKQKQWIVPTQESDVFLLGSTFHKQSTSYEPNPEDAHFLLERAKIITGKEVTLIKHERSVRPTVQHRRPYLGCHHTHKNLMVYNGLGSKGSALCSWLSPMMANFIVSAAPLHPEVKIN